MKRRGEAGLELPHKHEESLTNVEVLPARRGRGLMLRYLYLDLALGLIAVLVLVWITRRDLRSVILTVGPVGSLI